jgi:MOSC domain-containing protein YiiM
MLVQIRLHRWAKNRSPPRPRRVSLPRTEHAGRRVHSASLVHKDGFRIWSPSVRLVALSVSLPRSVQDRRGLLETGIFKVPVTGRVWMRRTNLEGDGQADLVNHGGEDKAVYAYPAEHYAAWGSELDAQLPYGQFGENLTIEGVNEDSAHVGDRFRIGDAEVEVTQPRVPCFKLGIRMGSPAFVKRFQQSERSGFYLRVVQEGQVAAGDAVVLTRSDPAGLSIRAVHRLMYAIGPEQPGWRAAVERAIAIPALSDEWRREFRERLS